MTEPRTKAALNRKFKAEGLALELVKDYGYFYFIYDDGGSRYGTHSVYVCHFNDCPDWYAIGVAYAARAEAEFAARAA